METAHRREKPFFAWIATNAPHAPLDVPEKYEALYKDRVAPNAAKFFGMIANIDDNMGKLREFLAGKHLDENTLVIFMNDNGGTAGIPVFNAGMRGTKGTPWQGGTRATSFWRWNKTFTPRDISALTAHIDVFPTLAEIAGASLSENVQKQVEGRSLLPLLRDSGAAWPDRFLFTQTGRWDPKTDGRQAKQENAAVRWGRYTLVATPKETQKEWQLFDLATDPGQKTNVAKDQPDVVAKLSAAYNDWWNSLPPYLVNEQQTGPRWNPFHEEYWKQYRGPGPNNAPVPDGFVLP